MSCWESGSESGKPLTNQGFLCRVGAYYRRKALEQIDMKKSAVVAGVARIVFFGVSAVLILWLAKSYDVAQSNKSVAEKSVAQASQSASNEVAHILGYKPLSRVTKNPFTGRTITIDDADVYRALDEMSKYLMDPYKMQLRRILVNTMIPLGESDRSRHIIVFSSEDELNTGPYTEISFDTEDMGAAMMRNKAEQDMDLWINQEEIAKWISQPPLDDLYIIAMLTHEFQHYLDFKFEYEWFYDCLYRREAFFNANLAGGIMIEADSDIVMLATIEQLALEIRGFEAMFNWLDTNPYGNVDLTGPYQTMRIALANNDRQTYASVLYDLYGEDLWGNRVIELEHLTSEEVKQIVIDEAYALIKRFEAGD